MKIQITQTCGVHGEVVEQDEIVEVDDPTAKLLVGIGKAVPYTAPPTIQNGDPKPQTQDPKPQTGDSKGPGSDGKP